VQSSQVAEIISRIRRYLPSQGPIKDFVHHNTLHTFQREQLTFHEALRQASRLYGANEYLALGDYRARYDRGEISAEAIRYVLAKAGGDTASLRAAMFETKTDAPVRRAGFRAQGYLYELTQSIGVRLEEEIHPTLFRLVANFLDQGIAAVSLSEEAHDFWRALQLQLPTARPYGISRAVAQTIARSSPEDAIAASVTALLPDGADATVFLLEVAMMARGWSGLIAVLEQHADYLLYSRGITLAEYLALYLALLADLAARRGYERTIAATSPNEIFFAEKAPPETPLECASRLWHEAFEFSYYFAAIAAIKMNAAANRSETQSPAAKEFQALFCVDDREGSLRRHLEEISPQVETFATPGFFAMDIVYQGPADSTAVKLCPVPMTPRYRIRGVVRDKHLHFSTKWEMNLWHRYANSLWFGWFISLFLGFASLIRLAFSIHKPARTFTMATSFSEYERETDLLYVQTDHTAHKGYYDGYTVPEMVERVASVLKEIGLTKHFAPIVAIFGHGSSSTNNPYFAAYDCGACAGTPGLVNARLFALMANREDVRLLLAAQEIHIPKSTYFVGGIHDTGRDEVAFFDEHLLPTDAVAKLAEFKRLAESALARNALERTRHFAVIDFPTSTAAAIAEVRQRTEMFFEPRPEYNHAGNAISIVGRRSLTEHMFFGRRAFLNSYDPRTDARGEILEKILAALVPVAAGINLEYLFSRLDGGVYGAGSKLAHNIFSLVGVGNGSEGDLRTGLPEQMTEIHDPIRMLLVIEQRLDVFKAVWERNTALRDWVLKEWIHCCLFDYVDGNFYFATEGAFVALDITENNPPTYADSTSAFKNQRESAIPALIRNAEARDAR